MSRIVDLIEKFVSLSQSGSTDLSEYLESIANASKSEDSRGYIKPSHFVRQAVPLLSIASDPNVLIQACRALGNACYDNEETREQFRTENGVAALVNLLRDLAGSDYVVPNTVSVACGCLLNILDDDEIASTQLSDTIVFESLHRIWKTHGTSSYTMIVMVTAGLSDNEKCLEKLCQSPLLDDIISHTKSLVNDYEDLEILLELGLTLVANDVAKGRYVVLGDDLISVIESTERLQEDSATACRVYASDIIVYLLSDDEVLRQLFSKGRVMESVLDFWLTNDDSRLVATGLLAVGNMARNDQNCMVLVERALPTIGDIVRRLLSEMISTPLAVGDVNDDDKQSKQVLVAGLSAIRNLAIPVFNKPILDESGLIDDLLSIFTDVLHEFVGHPEVIYKFLAIFRLSCDGQESVANKLAAQSKVLSCIGESASSPHPGVHGEACRLLAAICKNGRVTSALSDFLKSGGYKPIVDLIENDSDIMVTEGLVAVRLLLVSFQRILEGEIANLYPVIEKVLKSTTFPPEVKLNALSVLIALASTTTVKQYMVKEGVLEVAGCLLLEQDPRVNSKASELLQCL